MAVNWDDVQTALYPVKDYEDLCRRFEASFSFQFVRSTFNFTLPKLMAYTQKLLGGDARGRYTEYTTKLVGIFTRLHQAGVPDVLNLLERTSSRQNMEIFNEQTGVPVPDIAFGLKYLLYWLIPGEKYLSGLVRPGSDLHAAIKKLGELGVRTNLQLLEKGHAPAGRQSLVQDSGLPATVISELVNRADFSRMPWTSKATISNIIGAGYLSLAQLANADEKQLYEDFFQYGKSIGKNLKLGNEIESSYRVAKIIPVIVIGD